MIDHAFLIINKRGILGLRKKAPALESGEIAVKVEVSIPLSVFKDHIPTAHLDIKEEHVRFPEPDVQLVDPHERMP